MTNITASPESPRLLDMARREIRYRHYALSTEKAYVHWIKFFMKFQGLRHPGEMGVAEVTLTQKTRQFKSRKFRHDFHLIKRKACHEEESVYRGADRVCHQTA